jgi:hypothetical protein
VHDRAGGVEDVVHHLDDIARRMTLVEVVPCQLDEAARAEELAPAVTTEQTIDHAPDEIIQCGLIQATAQVM